MGLVHSSGSRETGKVFWVGGFCSVLVDFVLFNLCAVCMNKLLSIYKEPGSRGAITLSDPNTFLDNNCHPLFPVASTG